MRDAHVSDITGMACFPGEPILVTSSPGLLKIRFTFRNFLIQIIYLLQIIQ